VLGRLEQRFAAMAAVEEKAETSPGGRGRVAPEGANRVRGCALCE
jgi:hypothetical protein